MTSGEAQLASFFARYEPDVARLGKALRARLRARLPGLCEIVYLYERQESLVISYSPTENGYDGLFSLALTPGAVKLHFAKGPLLSKSDPNKLLQGSGKLVRHVVLESVADFERPEIEVLIAATVKLANVSLDTKAKGALILKAEEQKQRARRAEKAARAPATSRKSKARR